MKHVFLAVIFSVASLADPEVLHPTEQVPFPSVAKELARQISGDLGPMHATFSNDCGHVLTVASEPLGSSVTEIHIADDSIIHRDRFPFEDNGFAYFGEGYALSFLKGSWLLMPERLAYFGRDLEPITDFRITSPRIALHLKPDPKQKAVLAVYTGGGISVHDAHSGRQKWSRQVPAEAAAMASFNHDGRLVYYVDSDGAGVVFDGERGSALGRYSAVEALYTQYPQVVASSFTDHFTTTQTLEAGPILPKHVQLWNATEPSNVSLMQTFLIRGLEVGIFYSPPVTFTPRQVVVGRADGSLDVFDLALNDLVMKLTAHTSAVTAAGTSPTGDLVASGSNDGSIAIWSLDKANKSWLLSGNRERIWKLEFSPDGKTLLVTTWGENNFKEIGKYTRLYVIPIGFVR